MRSTVPISSGETKWPTDSKWPMVKLGEVITHYKEYIDAPEARLYPKLSVRLYGRGVVLDNPANGVALKMKRHQLARAGQVILSEIWGKKGAIGFVPEEGEGALCTSHFFLFDVNEGRLHRRWLEAIFRSNYLESQLGSRAFGTTGYAAVRPKDLLAAEIPLPPFTEQQRIVTKIDELAAKIHKVRMLRQRATNETEGLILQATESIFAKVTDSVGSEPLGKHVIIQGGFAFKSDEYVETGLPIVRITNLEDEVVNVRGSPCIHEGRLEQFKRFVLNTGDILIAMTGATTGKLGIVPRECQNWLLNQRVGRFLPKKLGELESKYVYWLARGVQKKIFETAYGGAQPNISPKDIEAVMFPFPALSVQQRIIVELDALQTGVDVLKRLQAGTADGIDALMPSILDKAFKGGL